MARLTLQTATWLPLGSTVPGRPEASGNKEYSATIDDPFVQDRPVLAGLISDKRA